MACEHRDMIQDVTPSAQGCEDCLKTGDTWINLRMCLTCGYVGCCDSSPNKHASHHFKQTGHPIVQAFKGDEDWVWCYIDKEFL